MVKILSCLSIAACGGNTHAPEPPTPGADLPHAATTAAVGSAAPSASATSAIPIAPPRTGAADGTYAPLWSADLKDWNHAIALLPSGDVIAQSMWSMRVLARDTGKKLEEAKTCGALRDGSLGVLSASEVILVCRDEVRRYRVPGLAFDSLVLKLPFEAETAVVGAGLIVVGGKKGEVKLYDAATFKERASFDVVGEVSHLALSHDGKNVAVHLENARLLLCDVASASCSNFMTTGARGSSMRFSPDGSQLFLRPKYFESGPVDVASKEVKRVYRMSSWVNGVRYLSPTLIATTGAHGFSLLSADGKAVELDHNGGEGIGASDDGSTVCGGDRSGTIRCFGTKKPEASTYVASRPTADPDLDRPTAAVSVLAVDDEVTGTLGPRKGNRYAISGAPGTLKVGDKGELSKRFSFGGSGFSLGGWLVIAEVKIVKINDNTFDVEVTREKGTMTKNGKKVNHFETGAAVRLKRTP